MSLKEHLPGAYEKLLDRPVAVFGAGTSGKAVSHLLDKLGWDHLTYDERSGEGETVRHAFSAKEAAEHQLVIHSPAFLVDHEWIGIAREAGCLVVSEIDFAQQFRRGPTIVVTGTNGKTTLQEFITYALKRCGISSVATGQNQYPLSRLAVHQELDGVTAVCEMGPAYAMQLREFRFDTLFWTNFHEDHIEDPVARKELFAGQARFFELSPKASFYLGDSVYSAAEEFGYPWPEYAKRVLPSDNLKWDLTERSAFATRIHRPALALFRKFWLDQGYSDSLLKGAAEHFEVRAHRLHMTTTIGKTRFWNDSNAGNFAATEAALQNFDRSVVWIGGGHYRGGDLEAFVRRISDHLKGAVVTGEVSSDLSKALKKFKVPNRSASDLRTAVEKAFKLADGDSPVVFSPGFIAGKEYGDFMARGICYENAVLGLKHQKGSV